MGKKKNLQSCKIAPTGSALDYPESCPMQTMHTFTEAHIFPTQPTPQKCSGGNLVRMPCGTCCHASPPVSLGWGISRWPVQQWAGVILSRACLPALHALKKTGWSLQGMNPSTETLQNLWEAPGVPSHGRCLNNSRWHNKRETLVGLVTAMEENSNSFRYQSL